jgi:hypothetical protein
MRCGTGVSRSGSTSKSSTSLLTFRPTAHKRAAGSFENPAATLRGHPRFTNPAATLRGHARFTSCDSSSVSTVVTRDAQPRTDVSSIPRVRFSNNRLRAHLDEKSSDTASALATEACHSSSYHSEVQ